MPLRLLLAAGQYRFLGIALVCVDVALGHGAVQATHHIHLSIDLFLIAHCLIESVTVDSMDMILRDPAGKDPLCGVAVISMGVSF